MQQLYDIYCDESCHLENDRQKAMTIGAIWCPDNKRKSIFQALREIKIKHGLKSDFELKWNKVSMSKIDFYNDIVNYFFDNDDLHFRVLVIPNKEELRHDLYGQTHDEFYYKMYFDMLKTILEPQNAYNIYIDIKDTQGQHKVEKLHDVLCHSQYDFDKSIIKRVQQVESKHVELVALADLFIGAISYLHRELTTSEAKLQLIENIRKRTGYTLRTSTLYRENKFNVFIWKPGYGRK